MTNETTDNSGQFETANHDLVDQDKVNTENVDSTDKQDTVKYKTHQKLLNQYKNQQDELNELRDYKRVREEEELHKKGEFEKLVKLRDEKISTLEKENQEFKRQRVEGKKINAVINKLPGRMKKDEYFNFVDIDSIQIDPETGQVDEYSLERAVNTFVQNYGEDCIKFNNTKGLPNVGHMGGKPNLKRNLKDLSREELRKEYLKGNFKE